MPRMFPEVKPGDPIKAWWFRAIFDELERWRKASAAPPLGLDYADSGVTPPQFHLGPLDLGLIPVEIPGTGCPAATNYWTPSNCTVKLLVSNPAAGGMPGVGFAQATGSNRTATMYSTFTTEIGGDGTVRFGWATRVGAVLYLVDGDC
jgi:hypothetical protein